MKLNKLISEEIEKFKLFSSYSTQKTLTENLNEQQLPGGITQDALNKILGYSKKNKSALKGWNLFPTQETEIDKEFGTGTFKKFFYGGGKELLKSDDPKFGGHGGGSFGGGGAEGSFDPNKPNLGGGDDPFNAYPCIKSAPGAKKVKFKDGTFAYIVDGVYYFSNGKKKLKDGTLTTFNCDDQSKPKPKTELKWKPEKFPLTYMMQGPNVKKLQQVLDVKDNTGKSNITGKFYKATQFALDKKAQELGLNYDRNVGLDQMTFNDIVNPRKSVEQRGVTPAPNDVKNIEQPTDPTQVTAPQVVAPQQTTPQEPLTRDQQMVAAKQNLQQTKDTLDQTKRTGTRSQKRAARGDQRAARQVVRSTRQIPQ